MITKNEITDKRTYSSPQIVLVKLDYKISLTLGSGEVFYPPIEPIGGEVFDPPIEPI